jgi:hypothetical protein
LAFTLTRWTSGDLLELAEERALCAPDFAFTVASRTFNNVGSRFCFVTVAPLAAFHSIEFKFASDTERGVSERYVYLELEIGSSVSGLMRGSTKERIKNISEAAKAFKTVKSTTCLTVHALMPELVILRFSLWVAQNLIRLVNLFESIAGVCRLVTVGVVLQRLLPKRLFKVFRCGITGNTENLIVVTFTRCHILRPLIL